MYVLSPTKFEVATDSSGNVIEWEIFVDGTTDLFSPGATVLDSGGWIELKSLNLSVPWTDQARVFVCSVVDASGCLGVFARIGTLSRSDSQDLSVCT